MSSFKNEFEKYETHLSSFDTIHSINFFFCKLLSSMKKKLLNIEKMSTIRENLFAKIVMLKKIIERERRTNSRVQNNFNFFKQKENKSKNKNQSQSQNQQQNQQQNRFNQNAFNNHERDTHAKSKRKRKKNFQNDESTCYRCQRKNHYFYECTFESNESNNHHIIVVVDVIVE